MAIARWTLLSRVAAKARSSHCAAVTDTGVCLIYGGELKPREPVDTEPLALSDEALNSAGGTVPIPRVGATTVWSAKDKHLYMWGGRGGVDMAPLGPSEVGMWRGSLVNAKAGGAVKLASVKWEKVSAKNEEAAPEARSYHASVAHNGKIYIHAGCPEKGRLSSLYTFDVQSHTWTSLAPGPEPGRGGTSLVFGSLKQYGDVLLRFGGFAGYELPTDNSLDIYSIANDVWHTVVPAPDPEHGHPGPRSVHGFTSFRSTSPSLTDAVAVLYHGEGEASNLGHAGAGRFYDDVWLLLDGKDGLAWKKVDAVGNKPEGRGWFPPVSCVRKDGDTMVLLFGGLLSSNERSDELWSLEIE
ncbi:hypothetical protein GLOTRDRAFT_76669 [Gloeophyllum trabeum ATCC 11539]|uniref:Galactose oxidase n=1 Tax=Gloeophyllum trabeum (strain ATCC 11539 / FP-39264 / Madison 617) TaxID=670483 RepID=S7RQW8_GLOTA|nr:uncharacterized protein GLOTRDRAFT_76669 [Gloeophyllum trabeum ATCC 11539]EPQ55309.1 hypothetical protein GLOTRDRAFT_76669 [Gloeophyllum trabeum ATCC 11539]